MKWILVPNKRNILEEYRLMEDDEIKAVVKYNPIQRSARITIGDMHRLFFIESTGSLTGKYVFKNEYGVQVGSMSNDKWGKEGSVLIESKKYTYTIENGPPARLTIYDAVLHRALASCGLSTSINGTSLSLVTQQHHADSNYLLLALCWFLYLPVAKENITEYAA